MNGKPFMKSFLPRGDARGWLVAVEGKKDISFDIKRIFYIYGTEPGTVRGQHANRNSEFVLINVCGECKVRVDNGKGDTELFLLNQPHEGVYIPRLYWKEMFDFSADSILLCLASEVYDSSEYIRDYGAYCEEMKGI